MTDAEKVAAIKEAYEKWIDGCGHHAELVMEIAAIIYKDATVKALNELAERIGERPMSAITESFEGNK